MYKFKNVKKPLIEFSRGEGLSVPTDSIKFVKVDGDELSGAASSGQDDVPTVESLMESVVKSYHSWSSSVVMPDAYFRAGPPGQGFEKIDSVEDLVLTLQDGLVYVIPAYLANTTPSDNHYYISYEDWSYVSSSEVTLVLSRGVMNMCLPRMTKVTEVVSVQYNNI